MAGRGRREVAAELAAAGERFARWRRGRVRGARIPRELWQLAIDLADRYGVSRVSGGPSRLLRAAEAMPLGCCR
jgi:hypothetical protein